MNLKFESLTESLDESLARNVELNSDGKELALALEDADMIMKDALENKKNVNTENLQKETQKEIVIKNANDEKIAAIKIDEVKSNSVTQSNEIEKYNDVKEASLQKEEGKLGAFMDKLENLGVAGRVLGSVAKVGTTLFDSLAKKFFKDKYKINYSTYNNGKKALTAAIKKDGKTFLKKGLDVALGLFKKIPSTTKMVIRNVKNKVLEEVFSLGKFLIAK